MSCVLTVFLMPWYLGPCWPWRNCPPRVSHVLEIIKDLLWSLLLNCKPSKQTRVQPKHLLLRFSHSGPLSLALINPGWGIIQLETALYYTACWNDPNQSILLLLTMVHPFLLAETSEGCHPCFPLSHLPPDRPRCFLVWLCMAGSVGNKPSFPWQSPYQNNNKTYIWKWGVRVKGEQDNGMIHKLFVSYRKHRIARRGRLVG